jgi:hypothetical protein
MPRKTRGTYYLGRVIKLGQLNQETLIRSLLNPVSINRGKHAWTFIDTKLFNEEQRYFIFGKLSKYSPDAQVKVVQPDIRTEAVRIEPNLSIASSPFIYIPAYSGVVFLHVVPHIPQWMFIRRFCEIILETNGHFFVSCEIETISDLRTFAAKLKLLDGIYEISATIFPPNPLFGPLWRPLKDYIDSRSVGTMEIKEEAKGDTPINTDLPKHVEAAAEQTEAQPYNPKGPLPIGDAAILMAADGYGSGRIDGKQGDKFITISTSETVRNFSFDRNPDPIQLYEIASRVFEEIERQRHLEH